MNAKSKLNLSQKQHLRLWRETIGSVGHDSVNHSYHASIMRLQIRKGRKASRSEKRSEYRKSKRRAR